MKRARKVGLPPVTIDPAHYSGAQIGAAIRLAIRTGRLRRGERLPSTRSLAAALHVSRQTVVRVYEDLIADGFIAGQVGAGSRVIVSVDPPKITARLNDPDHQGIVILWP